MKNLLAGLFGMAAFFASCSFAGSFPDKSGYLIDERGNVVKNAYGECWRTGYWTSAMAIAECDPGLVKQEEPKKILVVPPVIQEKHVVIPGVPLIRISAGTLFDFDKADVKPERQKILNDAIVTGLKLRSDTELLTITGHADRIGTEKYNQDLSERRAYAVKAYLEQQGIAVERMSAYGKGESIVSLSNRLPDSLVKTRLLDFSF
ncbi:MAG: OmpA family protein [Proteobacteria bacterium]|nr:OmpA family protein [Pseudomonadota bacterium]